MSRSSPLDSAGHLLESVSVSFQYAAGYTGGANGSTVSLVMLDAFNHSLVRTLWTSDQLSNYSYDNFKGYSPPITGGASGLALGWSHQMVVALRILNNDRNVRR